MENLHIKTMYSLKKRIILGAGLILLAVILGVLFGLLGKIYLAGSLIVPGGLGILYLTPLMGNYTTELNIGKGFLVIKWPDRGTINVLESEIDRIALSSKNIMIFRKARKDIKLVIYDDDQKAQVFKFFHEYAIEKNLTLAEKP